MSIFYPISSFCSPLPTHTASLPLTPTLYILLLLIILPLHEPLKKVHHASLRSDLRNKSVPSGFEGSFVPLVYLEGDPSYLVDSVLDVKLKGLV